MLTYVRGLLNSDGTITFDSTVTVDSNTDCYHPSITLDSDGYPWIAYHRSTNHDLYVVKATATDGSTWDTPTLLRDLGNYSYPNLVPLASGQLYLIYCEYTVNNLYGTLYDGSSWSSDETIETGLTNYLSFNAISNEDDKVYVTYNISTGNIYENERTSSGWGTATLVTTRSEDVRPQITLVSGTDDVYIFWDETGTDHVYYIKRTGGTWSSVTDWIDESADGIYKTWSIASSFKSYGGYIEVAYTTKTASPYDVKFAYLSVAVAYTQTLTETINITDVVKKQPQLLKFEYLTLTSLPVKVWSASREYSQAIGVIQLLFKEFEKINLETISVIDFLLSKHAEKFNIQPVSVSLYSIKKITKTLSQPTSVLTTPVTILELIRILTQPITVVSIKRVTYQRVQTQAVSVSAQPITLSHWLRLFTQPISISPEFFKSSTKLQFQPISVSVAKIILSQLKKIQSITTVSTLTKVWQATRSLTQLVTTLTIPTSIYTGIRVLSQPVTIDVSLVKAPSKLRAEAISVLTLPTTISQVIRLLTQPVAVTSLPFKSSTKITLQPIDVLDTKTILNQFQRVKLQSITAVPALTRVWKATRSFTQPVTILTTSTFIYTILRILTQPVSIAPTLTKAVEKSVSEIVKPCVIEMVFSPELGRYILILDNEIGIL